MQDSKQIDELFRLMDAVCETVMQPCLRSSSICEDADGRAGNRHRSVAQKVQGRP